MILSLSHPRNLGSLAFVTGVTSIVWCLFVGWSGPSNAYTGAILALAFALALDFGRRKKIAEIELDAKSDDATSVRQILVNGVQVGTLPAREVAELKLGVALDPAIYASQFLVVGRTLLYGALLAFAVAPLLAIWAVLINLWIDPHHTAQTALIVSRTVQSLANHGQVLDMFDSVAEATARCAGGIWMLGTSAIAIVSPANYFPNVFRRRFHFLLRQRVNCAADGATQMRTH
ncbi:hypothetical protein [Burkholderia ubonensis]|uniref:Uncharacterized protein n=1 Tax=Burkholderia ubonensis subsp. mesacidophila TaxID=265293 RepID=A0A2A4FCY2_9BURK|nr:hypothetical protein [Burkholderia ubonensis]PCE30286.1 hypothetical protein BZL54_21590 [Burkholderia ubonensis subsp. mesacidophila]